MKIYKVTLKTRSKMEKTIARQDWGWWIDICPGKTLTLRDANADDISRCILSDHSSRNPDDYYCELSTHGALVNKMAVEAATELTDGRV
jgi:hypothetical protein